MNYKRKNICRCCGGKKLVKYLKLHNQPLANSYHKSGNLPEYPLEVNLCKNCFHSQLSVVVDPTLLFKNYLYVSGTTETFRNHCKELALNAIKRKKEKKLSVLDIACNDGTQLEIFRNLSCEVWGVDPAENLRKITLAKKIPVVVDYWNQKVAKNLDKQFDFITGTNVFAHVDDLDEFLKATKIALKDDGVLILEFPYAHKMVENNEFDTVYHEHLSYFTVNSFKTLMDRMGLFIFDVIQTPIHGGSIRFFVNKNNKSHSAKVIRLIKMENDRGLLNVKSYRDFSNRVNKNKYDLQKLIKKLRLKKENVIGYGASAKGNTMLNYFKLDLDYIVDDNPLKWGYKTPGRDILIKDPKVMSKEAKVLNIVILSWNFYSEIIKKIKIITKRKDKYILYVPRVMVK